ncbi:MAG: hypothetical protein QOC62_6604 [Mycobacterium sp.]|jgi:hypothetical protein|nr:hypothetical protein [Mycobacterium sp.]
MYDDGDDTYVSVEECATRMGLTVQQVVEAVNSRTLRARRYGGWSLEVEPAILTNVVAPVPGPGFQKPSYSCAN